MSFFTANGLFPGNSLIIDAFFLGLTYFVLGGWSYSEGLKPMIRLIASYSSPDVNVNKIDLIKESLKIAFFVFFKVLVLLITGLLFFRHFSEASISFVSGLVAGLTLFTFLIMIGKNPMNQQA